MNPLSRNHGSAPGACRALLTPVTKSPSLENSLENRNGIICAFPRARNVKVYRAPGVLALNHCLRAAERRLSTLWFVSRNWDTGNNGCVSPAPKRRASLPRLRLRLTPITWPGMGSKPLQSSKNGALVLTFWYVKRRNRPRRFHDLVESRRDRRTPIVRLSGEPPRDPNVSSAPPVMYSNRLTPGEVKETHPNQRRPLAKTSRMGIGNQRNHLDFAKTTLFDENQADFSDKPYCPELVNTKKVDSDLGPPRNIRWWLVFRELWARAAKSVCLVGGGDFGPPG